MTQLKKVIDQLYDLGADKLPQSANKILRQIKRDIDKFLNPTSGSTVSSETVGDLIANSPKNTRPKAKQKSNIPSKSREKKIEEKPKEVVSSEKESDIIDGSGGKNVGKTPTYKIGDTDGGPGVWSKETTPAKGANYQGKVTGAPKGTEYVVETSAMKSGRKKFDGYDPDSNVLIDAKDWKTGKGGWPVEGQKWSKEKVIKEASDQAKIGKEVGSKVEWHVPTKEKAAELRRIFKDEGIDVGVKVIPKN